jgi:dTDP-4-dehydrorhamnose reductase
VRILILGGATGYLGKALTRHCSQAGIDAIPTFCRRPASDAIRLNICDPDALESILRETAPDAVINTASVVDDWGVTATGAALIARACATRQLRLLHVSSDAIHSGRKPTYTEQDHPDPISPYGAAKAAAELAVAALCPGAVIARTSWILGDGRSPFEQFVHALAADPATGTLFNDDLRCAVTVDELARALIALTIGSYTGIINTAGTEAISRAELGRLIAARDGLDINRLPTGLKSVTGTPGMDLRLDSSHAREHLGLTLTGARTFLARTDRLRRT